MENGEDEVRLPPNKT